MSLVVTRVLGLVTVQDFGRPGYMHEGLPHGGALVRQLLVHVNRAAGNVDDAAAIEVLGRLTVRATAPIEIATESGARRLATDEEFTIASEPRRVAYLAVRGGVDAPIVLGSRSTHLSAGLGTPIKSGTQLTALAAPRDPTIASPRDAHVESSVSSPRDTHIASSGSTSRDAYFDIAAFDRDEPIRIISGPDGFADNALETLLSSMFRISPNSDRIGTRLDGPGLPRSNAPETSRPMVRGAIEVPGDGQPIVLGPEHPTTGGYPVIAVIATADMGRFFAIRLGGNVRFTR